MEVCHRHNRRAGLEPESGPFGLRLSLPPGDPMRSVLGDDWVQYEWFSSESARETKIEELLGPFPYYRKGDRPSFLVERVERDTRPEARESEE